MKTKSLGFIGGGRITKIFLQAFAKKNAKHGSIIVYDTNNEVLSSRKREFPSIETADSAVVAAKQDIVFIALHPPMIMETLDKISGDLNESTLVVSLAPKISLDKFESKLKTKNIVRMIPNATSYINEGFNPVTFNPDFADDEKPALIELFNLLGKTFEVTESKLEAYAILSAMLPTYFWFQWKELGKLGAQLGLTEKETRKAIRATLKKAIKLYYKSGLSPEEVIDLIPVKPIGEHQGQITEIYRIKLLGLYEKIKP